MKAMVFRYGRFNGATGIMDMVGDQWATLEKIESLNADAVGEGVEVDQSEIVDGRWTKGPTVNRPGFTGGHLV